MLPMQFWMALTASCSAVRRPRATTLSNASAPWLTLRKRPKQPCGTSKYSLNFLLWFVTFLLCFFLFACLCYFIQFVLDRNSSGFDSHSGYCCCRGCIQVSGFCHYHADHDWHNCPFDGQVQTSLSHHCSYSTRAGRSSVPSVAWHSSAPLRRYITP